MAASIFDDYQLTKETFEDIIGVGMTMRQILIIFRTDAASMDEWCGKEYGIPSFQTIYEMIRQMSLAEYLDTVKLLGERGNPSALNIMNQALMNLTQQQTVKIVFDGGAMQPVGEEDKEDE